MAIDTASPAYHYAKQVSGFTKTRMTELMQKFEEAGVMDEVNELLQLQSMPVAQYLHDVSTRSSSIQLELF